MIWKQSGEQNTTTTLLDGSNNTNEQKGVRKSEKVILSTEPQLCSTPVSSSLWQTPARAPVIREERITHHRTKDDLQGTDNEHAQETDACVCVCCSLLRKRAIAYRHRCQGTSGARRRMLISYVAIASDTTKSVGLRRRERREQNKRRTNKPMNNEDTAMTTAAATANKRTDRRTNEQTNRERTQSRSFRQGSTESRRRRCRCSYLQRRVSEPHRMLRTTFQALIFIMQHAGKDRRKR